jgi:hypothetical protein
MVYAGGPSDLRSSRGGLRGEPAVRETAGRSARTRARGGGTKGRAEGRGSDGTPSAVDAGMALPSDRPAVLIDLTSSGDERSGVAAGACGCWRSDMIPSSGHS